jgi:cellulose biosynthesis protein BcsQ
MIVALINQLTNVGWMTLALHLARTWANGSTRVVVIAADPQAAVQRGITVAELLRDLLSRDFPDNAGWTA